MVRVIVYVGCYHPLFYEVIQMTNDQKDFIEKVASICIKYYPTYPILPSLTIAQTIKESGWGKSLLSSKYHNYHGIKWYNKCGYNYVELPTKEWNGKQYISVIAKFIIYPDLEKGTIGYYEFLKRFKRYAPLFGETNSASACIKLQQSGYATAPNYGFSVYNDYILKYDLLKYDVMALGGFDYLVGNTYTLQSNMYIRKEPNGEKKEFSQITENAKKNGYADKDGFAILNKGTRVTCKEVVNVEDKQQIWVQIPSGYVCGKTKDKIYIL